MELLRILLVFHSVFSNVKSVLLNSKGGYENLVINIEPNVKNLTFVTNIKEIINTFSRTLCAKTERRLIINTVTVVLPLDYIEETLDEKIKNQIKGLDDETLPKQASIVVGSSNASYQHPFLKTVHLGGCGQQGEYIHISPALMEKTTYLNRRTAYLLLHEWAHYRWGLFDEYGVTGEDIDSPFYLTVNKTIKPIACPANLKGWMLTSDLKPCGRNHDLLPQSGCQFHLYYNKSIVSSLLMGYGVNGEDEFCGGSSKVIEHNPSPLSPHNLKCQHKSAFDILKNHSDFKNTPMTPKECMRNVTITYLKRKMFTNAKIIVILDQFEDQNTTQKIKSALNLVSKYGPLSNFTLKVEDVDKDNLTKVVNKYSPPPEAMASSWVITDKPKHISKLEIFSGIYILVPQSIKENWTEPSWGKSIIKIFSDKLSRIQIAESFIEIVVRRIIPEDKVPEQIYKHLFTNGDVRGTFTLDSNCGEALFIASEVNMSNGDTNLTGSLIDPNGELCSTSPCSMLESDGTSMAFKMDDGSWKKGKWSYEVNVMSNSSISVRVICRLAKKSLQIIPRLFTKNPENKGTYNASIDNNIVVLAASVMYDANPVLNASVYVDIDSDEYELEEGNRRIQLYDDGIGSDMTKSDGIYTNECHNFKGKGHYSFSFGVNINGSSKVLSHHQFLKTDDKVGVGRKMNFPVFIIKNDSIINNLTEKYGGPKSEFSYEELVASPIDEIQKPSLLGTGLEIQERKSESVDLEVISFDTHDRSSPGQVTDLKVTNISYKLSFVTLEWTSAGDDGLSGTAESIDMKFTMDGSELTSHFFEEGRYTKVDDNNLMEKGSLTPKSARTKHAVSVKVPLKPGASYQEDAIYFFALVYSDEVNNGGMVSNVAYAFFKPAEYSDEIKEILNQQNNGFLIVLVFIFFIALLGVFICVIKLYQRHRRHLQRNGFSPEQILKYST